MADLDMDHHVIYADERERLLENDIQEKTKRDAVSYEEAVKATGFGVYHVLLLFLCGWAVSSDAIEVLSVSFMLPSAQCDLGLNSTDKGVLNSIIFLGMMVGGYFWGSMADKFGRRAVLLGSLTVNGLGGLASSTAQVFWLFLLLRFISGVGVGGSIPVIFSYFTEFQPKHRRGTMISALATFWMCGNIIAAGLAWIIIPHGDLGKTTGSFKYDSWRIFVAVCTIPSLSSAAMFFFMPESPKYYLHIGNEAQALRVLRKVYSWNTKKEKTEFKVTSLILTRDQNGDIVIPDDSSQKMGCWSKFKSSASVLLTQTKELFSPSLRRSTIVLIIINFALSFGYYGLWMWFPELFNRVEKYGGSPCDHAKGNSSINATQTCPFVPEDWVFFEGFMTALSNLPGNLITIFLMDRIGRKPLLATSMVLSGVSVFLIPVVHNKVQNLLISCLFGAVSTVGWNSLDVLQAELFPTGVRSTAFGVQSGVGRVAAILGNLTFGLLVDVHCAIPMIMVSVLLAFGGLSAIRLPNTTNTDIH